MCYIYCISGYDVRLQYTQVISMFHKNYKDVLRLDALKKSQLLQRPQMDNYNF